MEESGIEISLNDYAAGLAQYSNLGYEGYTFGIPADAQSMVICYNKNMLAQYGNKLPQTHAELIELCDEVAQAENIKRSPYPPAWNSSPIMFSRRPSCRTADRCTIRKTTTQTGQAIPQICRRSRTRRSPCAIFSTTPPLWLT